jgi:endonuclease I
MLKYLLLILINMVNIKGFPYHNIIKQTIIHDIKMPSIYLEKEFYSDNHAKFKNKFLSAEHIYPQCMLMNKHSNDMHNIIKTFNTLNVNRSNYMFVEDVNIKDKNWVELEFGNYVNHKTKMFAPNNYSRGFISRAILHMCREYDYNHKKVIDKDILIKWFFNNPPLKEERYHNEIIHRIQRNHNIFITNYFKKNNVVIKFINKL